MIIGLWGAGSIDAPEGSSIISVSSEVVVGRRSAIMSADLKPSTIGLVRTTLLAGQSEVGSYARVMMDGNGVGADIGFSFRRGGSSSAL
jgi:hypothetical protein